MRTRSRFSLAYTAAVVALEPVPVAITAPRCSVQRMQTCAAETECALAMAPRLVEEKGQPRIVP